MPPPSENVLYLFKDCHGNLLLPHFLSFRLWITADLKSQLQIEIPESHQKRERRRRRGGGRRGGRGGGGGGGEREERTMCQALV